MIEYIYFVKCPNCEDEHFDFFDKAKGFALGCLSKKPIITQVEVNRNDFGECTDSFDHGMIWSWEDECKECDSDIEQEKAGSHILTKADLENVPESDPEFDALDNSVEVEDDDFRFVNTEEELRKPIPEGMTIEQLVEEMEENEDEVECTWCNELFPKDQCRYEVDLGYLCSRCEAAIKSRGETLTFRENSYLDSLDEEAEEDLTEHVNEEHPAIESDQKLDGIDNAVVDCKAAEVITHSEDEKPVDCKGEKKPLEKPLTEETETSEISESEELEVSPASKIRLATCPECGAENAFDHDTGVCNNCGFII